MFTRYQTTCFNVYISACFLAKHGVCTQAVDAVTYMYQASFPGNRPTFHYKQRGPRNALSSDYCILFVLQSLVLADQLQPHEDALWDTLQSAGRAARSISTGKLLCVALHGIVQALHSAGMA
jgi:hypothetical protein